jgi:hypothetical protein
MSPDRMEPTACSRIAACKQGDVVTQFDKLVDKPSDYSLCPAIQFRRNALGQRSNLGDAHENLANERIETANG